MIRSHTSAPSGSRPSRRGLGPHVEDALVVAGQHEREPARGRRPSRRAAARRPATRSTRGARSSRSRTTVSSSGRSGAEVDQLAVDAVVVEVEDVGDAAGHPGREVAPGRAEDDARVPPVMYSQPWSPTPSTTAVAPELRTQKRSPTRPRRNSSPVVAP